LNHLLFVFIDFETEIKVPSSQQIVGQTYYGNRQPVNPPLKEIILNEDFIDFNCLKDRIGGNNDLSITTGYEIEGVIQFRFTSEQDMILQDIVYVNSMQSYLQSVKPDCKIILPGNHSNGFRCHSCILTESSEVIKVDLENYRDSKATTAEALTSITPPTYMTSTGVNALLRYLYYRDREEIRINAKVASELLQAADYYGIPRLTNDCVAILKQITAGITDAETLIDLFKFLRLKGEKELRTIVGETLKM
jgi:hypothetical protein